MKKEKTRSLAGWKRALAWFMLSLSCLICTAAVLYMFYPANRYMYTGKSKEAAKEYFFREEAQSEAAELHEILHTYGKDGIEGFHLKKNYHLNINSQEQELYDDGYQVPFEAQYAFHFQYTDGRNGVFINMWIDTSFPYDDAFSDLNRSIDLAYALHDWLPPAAAGAFVVFLFCFIC